MPDKCLHVGFLLEPRCFAIRKPVKFLQKDKMEEEEEAVEETVVQQPAPDICMRLSCIF